MLPVCGNILLVHSSVMVEKHCTKLLSFSLKLITVSAAVVRLE